MAYRQVDRERNLEKSCCVGPLVQKVRSFAAKIQHCASIGESKYLITPSSGAMLAAKWRVGEVENRAQ